MARAAVLGRLTWRAATIADLRDETATARTLVLSVPGWPGHLAGQHVDIRLTSADGYQAVRSYSMAAPADGDRIEVTVEQVEDGEVSPYLATETKPGDAVEVRGPIGGWFVWEPSRTEPVQLVAGGSGIVPLMAMLRERAAAKSDVPATLLYSSRTYEDTIYRSELETLAAQGVTVAHTLTRMQPQGWRGLSRRIDRAMLESTGFAVAEHPRIFICGPTPMVEEAARDLRDLGHAPNLIKTERFGPTGR
jgi:ferredoxin-NADP reductase